MGSACPFCLHLSAQHPAAPRNTWPGVLASRLSCSPAHSHTQGLAGSPAPTVPAAHSHLSPQLLSQARPRAQPPSRSRPPADSCRPPGPLGCRVLQRSREGALLCSMATGPRVETSSSCSPADSPTGWGRPTYQPGADLGGDEPQQAAEEPLPVHGGRGARAALGAQHRQPVVLQLQLTGLAHHEVDFGQRKAFGGLQVPALLPELLGQPAGRKLLWGPGRRRLSLRLWGLLHGNVRRVLSASIRGRPRAWQRLRAGWAGGSDLLTAPTRSMSLWGGCPPGRRGLPARLRVHAAALLRDNEVLTGLQVAGQGVKEREFIIQVRELAAGTRQRLWLSRGALAHVCRSPRGLLKVWLVLVSRGRPVSSIRAAEAGGRPLPRTTFG